ncbi:MAG TPA: hypothetical protein V6D29_09470 [Leptolyngbyaceae cyanobacterium]
MTYTVTRHFPATPIAYRPNLPPTNRACPIPVEWPNPLPSQIEIYFETIGRQRVTPCPALPRGYEFIPLPEWGDLISRIYKPNAPYTLEGLDAVCQDLEKLKSIGVPIADVINWENHPEYLQMIRDLGLSWAQLKRQIDILFELTFDGTPYTQAPPLQNALNRMIAVLAERGQQIEVDSDLLIQ